MTCRPRFNPATSLLAGMSMSALQTALENAQQAYINLLSGNKGESFSYTQGDGTKSVTYTRANIAELSALIQLLQSQLGVVERVRRPLQFYYR